MFRRIPLALAVLGLLVFVPARSSAQASIEYELLGLVNGGRSHALAMHSGLVGPARSHSRSMSSTGLNHNGAQGRISGADPDPYESNGAPDDGFTGTWCENVAYVSGVPEGSVAQRIYDGWVNS